MSTQQAYINPSIVDWARKRSSATRDSVAKSVGVSVEAIEKWESGASVPTLRQARALSDTLRIPFGFLYLERPPDDKIPLPDLRTITGTAPSYVSPEFLDVLNDSIRKQHWLREFFIEEKAKILPFVGSFVPNVGVDAVASSIRDALQLEELRHEATGWGDFLARFVHRVEELRVIVLRNSVVGLNNSRPLSVHEFRGFVISDDLAPLIFINAADPKAAQIFTLAHELAHVWLGESGISSVVLEGTSDAESFPIEKFCNQTAAEILTPRNDFIRRWNPRVSDEGNVQTLAAFYRVSKFVVLKQARELNRIGADSFFRLWEHEKERLRLQDEKRAGGGDFYLNLPVKNSYLLTQTVVEGVNQGVVQRREAANVLGLHLATLDRFIEQGSTTGRE